CRNRLTLRSALQHLAKVIVTAHSKFVDQFHYAVAIFATHGPEETFRKMFSCRLRVSAQDSDQILIQLLLAKRVLNKLRQAAFDRDSRPQLSFKRGATAGYQVHCLAGLRDSPVLFSLASF